MKVNSVTFRAGETKGATPRPMTLPTVTILVGPNNSGKSLALREIDSYCKNPNQNPMYGQPQLQRKVIANIEIDFPQTFEEAKRQLLNLKIDTPPNTQEKLGPDDFWVGVHTFAGNATPPMNNNLRQRPIRVEILREEILNYDKMKEIFCPLFTVHLDATSRFSLINDAQLGPLDAPPQNHLAALFRDEDKKNRVRKLTKEAFNLYFLIDPISIPNLKIKFCRYEPKPDQEILDKKNVEFFKSAESITNFGDGVKVFTGLVSAVLSLHQNIMLIDEPEAYLHPPLAHRLGSDLAYLSKEREASLIVATHSSDFLFGCLDSGIDVSVVRLTYEPQLATARVLDSGELRNIMHDPIMRSTHVLQALFTRTAIVTEGDTDRVFYEEINRRLQLEGRGIKDGLFLDAHNISAIHKIVGPLRKIGIPAVAIPDLDLILHQEKTVWQNLLSACQVPKKEWDRIQEDANSLATKGDYIKENGLDLLDPVMKAKGESLLKELKTYGLFIVPVGELERWLKKVGAQGEKTAWVIDMFSKIGNWEGDPNYLKPAADDVWAFFDDIANWVEGRIAER